MPKKLPYKTFIKTFELVPRVAFNLLISDREGQILLTKRAISPFKNHWHLPGSFLLKGETILECLRRIAKNEVGVHLDVKKAKLSGVFEDIDKDPRGHVIDVVYGYKLTGKVEFNPGVDTKEIRFFKKLPSKIGFSHLKTLHKLGYK